MNATTLKNLAAIQGGSVAATREEMMLFSFSQEAGALRFATITGGMLIRGLVRGAVDVAVLPRERS